MILKKGLIDLDYILKNAPDAYRIFTNYSSGEQKEDYVEANDIKVFVNYIILRLFIEYISFLETQGEAQIQKRNVSHSI